MLYVVMCILCAVICMRMYMCICTYMCMYIKYVVMCMCEYMHVYTYMHVYILCVVMCMCISICIHYVLSCVCVCICIMCSYVCTCKQPTNNIHLIIDEAGVVDGDFSRPHSNRFPEHKRGHCVCWVCMYVCCVCVACVYEC